MKIEKKDPTKNKNQLIRTNQITILKILRVGDTQEGFLFIYFFYRNFILYFALFLKYPQEKIVWKIGHEHQKKKKK